MKMLTVQRPSLSIRFAPYVSVLKDLNALAVWLDRQRPQLDQLLLEDIGVSRSEANTEAR